MLLVEDDEALARRLQASIEKLGHTVVGIASSAAEVFAHCESALPDIVLMDITIRGPVDGIDTAAALLEKHGLHVIYLTGDTDVASVERAKHTRPHAYLLKPVRLAELQGALAIAVRKRAPTERPTDD